jgi:hypothetical protein
MSTCRPADIPVCAVFPLIGHPLHPSGRQRERKQLSGWEFISLALQIRQQCSFPPCDVLTGSVGVPYPAERLIG